MVPGSSRSRLRRRDCPARSAKSESQRCLARGKQAAMTVELGHFALILALALSMVQAVLPVLGARRNDDRMMAVATPAAFTVFALIALSFAALTSAYVLSDFSVQNVFENSHSQKPLLYKFTGVWGNHEGSMLLWVLILNFFSALVGFFGNNLPPALKANVLGVQAWIGTAFLLFIVATSNPFTRINPAPIEGRDLQPDPAGHRSRDPSANALPWLCRFLCLLFLCGGRAYRWPHRRRMGSLGAPLGFDRMAVSDRRYRHGLVLGLLRTWLGRLVVLGPRRKRIVHAVARGYGPAAFGPRHGKALRTENLDVLLPS